MKDAYQFSGQHGKRLRMGLVGAGGAASEHQRGFVDCPEALLIGVTAGSAPEIAEAALRWQIQGYANLDTMLEDPRIDAVIIASPTPLHVAHAVAALHAGKHVLLEKPVAPSCEEIQQLEAVAATHRLICMPGHNDVYYSPLWRARDLLKNGDLGTLVYANFAALHTIPPAVTVSWRTSMPREGALADSGVHQIYQAHYVLGQPCSVVAQMARVHLHHFVGLIDDIASVGVQYASGAVATIIQGWAADDTSSSPWVLSVKLVGTHGSVWIDPTVQMADLTTAAGRRRIELNPEHEAYMNRFAAQLRHFVAAVQGGPPPLSTMADAVACQHVVDLAYQSVRENRILQIDPAASLRL